jgi:hypothetical protein
VEHWNSLFRNFSFYPAGTGFHLSVPALNDVAKLRIYHQNKPLCFERWQTLMANIAGDYFLLLGFFEG